MAQNSSHSGSERGVIKKTDLDLSQVQALFTQNKEMQQQIASLTKQLSQVQMNASAVASSSSGPTVSELTCDFCGGNHRNGECAEEQVNFVGGGQRRPYPNNYNQGYNHNSNHPNFSWHSPSLQPPQQQQPPPQEKQPSSLESIVEKLALSTSRFMEETRSNFNNQGASIRNLEVQVGQIAKQLSERSPGSFPGDTVPNPKEQCNAISLRSGKTLPELTLKPQKNASAPEAPVQQVVKDPAPEMPRPKATPASKEDGTPTPIYTKVPFPQRLQKQGTQKQFAKFMEVLSKLQINIPFVEALEQMPAYARFMKDLLTKKRRMPDEDTVMLTEECSAILQKKLPPKLKDPGSFNLPCEIGGTFSGKALCDLGASINLMPLSVFEKLGIGEAKPTSATLQLADRSILHPWGVVEDVLVKVDQFILPMDFMIVDISDAGSTVPLIFGRPFLATAGVVIDVPRGEVTLRVNGEFATLKIFQKPPFTSDLFPPLFSNHHPHGVAGGADVKAKADASAGSLRPP